VTSSSPESAPQSANPQSSDAQPTDSPNQQLLEYAWERHDTYSDNASKAQNRFFFVRGILAYLTVLVVFLSVLQPVLLNQAAGLPFFTEKPVEDHSLLALFAIALQELRWLAPKTWLNPVAALAAVDFLLILLPILATGLLAFAVKFDRGNNWILLRGNSESLKMEIFYYRTRAKQYKSKRNSVLAERIQLISERVKGSAVHQAALSPYEGQPETRQQRGFVIVIIQKLWDVLRLIVQTVVDFLFQFREVEVKPKPTQQNSQEESQDSMAPKVSETWLKRYANLNADNYIQYRLEDQFNWYRRKAKVYDRNYQILQTSVYVFGGFGTLLAAIGFQNWVAVVAALATSLANYLEYRRVEATLVGYNQAADALYDIRAWWCSLGPDEQAKPANFEKLVINTEETIRSEHTSWLQDMQDRLANLYGEVGEEEPKDGEGEENSASETQTNVPPDVQNDDQEKEEDKASDSSPEVDSPKTDSPKPEA
jgi:hypothetical protein